MKKKVQNSQLGFTLAELLAAMMVFSIIMLACANLVNQAGNSFKTGMSKVQIQDSARVINQEFFRILAGATTADAFPFLVKKSFTTIEGGGADSLFVVSGTGATVGGGAAQEVHFWVEVEVDAKGAKRGTLYSRAGWTGASNSTKPPHYGHRAYDVGGKQTDLKSNLGSWNARVTAGASSALAENVWSFQVRAYDENGDEVVGDYDSYLYGRLMPTRVEVELEILDEETWAKFGSGAFPGLVANNKRTVRYTQTYSNRGYWDETL